MPAENDEQIGMWPKYVEPGQMMTRAGVSEDLPAGMKPESENAAEPESAAKAAAPAPSMHDEPPGMRPRM